CDWSSDVCSSDLADCGGFAGPVDANHKNDFRGAVNFLNRTRVGGIQNCEQFVFQQALKFVDVLDLLAVGFFSKLAQNFLSRDVAQVGADKSRFQIVECRPINFLAEGNNVLEALAEV